MPTYRLLTGTHTVNGVTYVANDKERNTLSLTEEQAKALEGRLQLVSQTETNTGTGGAGDNTVAVSTTTVGESSSANQAAQTAPQSQPAQPVLVTGFFASEWNAERLASATAAELIEGVSHVSSLEMLDAIHTEEEKGKARKTVLQAITERYKEVEEAQK